MNNNKPKLAIDNDDVLINLIDSLLQFNNENYGVNNNRTELKQFELEPLWNVTIEEALRRVDEFWQSDYFANLEPVDGAFDAVQKLKEKYDLYVLTARPEEVQMETKLAIDKHFPDLFTNVHFAPAFGNGKKQKVEVCKELGIEILIDDGIHNLELCAPEGIKCYLFTTPWNEHHTEEELKAKNIVRIKNWKDAIELLG